MYGFNFKLDDFQEEAIRNIREGKSVVVCAPTGAGKTCIAESAIHLALENNKRIFYTTPLKALSNQKYHDFSTKYGIENVGLLTGDTTINRDARIVVMTTEVFRNMLYGTTFGTLADNLKDVKYVVLDEVHYMNDESRGTVWEESIIYCPTNIQIIALSATVQNSKQLTDWINTVHSRTEHIYTDFRPVPLRFYYYDSSKPHTVMPLMTPEGKLNGKIRPESKYKYFNSKKTVKNPATDIILALHEKNMLPCIYFTFSRKKCDENALKCSSLELLTKEETIRANKMVEDYIAENPYLYNNSHIELVKKGIASHHAGLLPGWKNLVERMFQEGLIKAVFATETLAAGINMPARTTVISSISKRTDDGHRILTANEFLQMSGRAGRRGMDEIGYVVIAGTPFQTPEEVYELATSTSNPLESKFSPSYSMVLNLLQRFSLDEAKELILKTFGYFSSTDRITPLLNELGQYKENMETLKNFKCPHGHNTDDMNNYIKYKNLYVEHRTVLKALRKQTKNQNSPEILQFKEKTKEFLDKVHTYGCDGCKIYKKHKKEIELYYRYQRKAKKLRKEIEFQKDIYWQKFLSHKRILETMGNLKDDYPTDTGKVTMGLRIENELYLSEIILSGILDELAPYELASIICAVATEEVRNLDNTPIKAPSQNVRKVLSKIKDIRRKIFLLERDNNIENMMNVNSEYSSLIEAWVLSANEETTSIEAWDKLFADTEFTEGDVVRAFKRTIDILRQLTVVDNIPESVVMTAKEAIKAINREPVNVE